MFLASEEHPDADVIRTKVNLDKNRRILPVVWKDDLLGGVHETGLSVGWGVEDLARILVGGAHDDETGRGIGSAVMFGLEIKTWGVHVKHADSAQVTGIPLTHVILHGRLDRIREFADNRDCPRGTGQMTFFVSVDGLFEGKEGEQDGEGSVQP